MRTVALTALVTLLCAPAAYAEEAAAASTETWGSLNVTAGLQMWTPVLVAEPGTRASPATIVKPQLIGPVVKVHYAFSEMVGAHVRGTMGFNSIESPGPMDTTVEVKSSAWAGAIGLDVYKALGRSAMWYNTVGFGFGGGKLEQDDLPNDHPDTTFLGPYFVTGFDVTLMGSMGVWMDWGCQAVGPVSGTVDAGDVKTWHINPLGAGGMRFLF